MPAFVVHSPERRCLALAAAVLLVAAFPPVAGATPPLALNAGETAHFQSAIRPLLQTHCFACHGPDKEKSGIRFDTLNPQALGKIDIEHLVHARDVLTVAEMPPDDADVPLADGDRQTLLTWIGQTLGRFAVHQRAAEPPPGLRRLTKREYNHTLQDIFGEASGFDGLLPPDPISESGYDTAHDLLMISQVDLRIYLEAADIALEKFLHLGVPSGEKELFFFELEDIYHFSRLRGYAKSKQLAPAPLSAAEFALRREAHARMPVTYRNRKYGPLPFGHIPHGVTEGLDEGIGFERAHAQYLVIKTRQRTGEVVVRVHAGAVRGADGSFPRLRLEAGRRFEQNIKVVDAGEHDVKADESRPGVYTFRFLMQDALPLTPGSDEDRKTEHLFIALSNVARSKDGVLAASPFGQDDLSLWTDRYIPGLFREFGSAVQQMENAVKAWTAAKTNLLRLDALEVEILPAHQDPRGPWNLPPPASPAEERKLAENALGKFLPRIFRRPLGAGELARYLGLYETQRGAGHDFKAALKGALTSAMVSPSFLYIGKPAEGLAHADSLAYASKLAYFLWSSPPDARLVELAASGRLRDEAVLSAEIARMLDDPRARRLSATFATQWLALPRLDNVQFDYALHPEYGQELAALTKRQTIETFQGVFHAGADARNLFRSDTMLLNDVLARHYGLPPVEGGDLRTVPTPATRNPGGILTHASILALNSDGKQSHPVKRGAWLLERILNDPPPPPPPAVPDLDPNSANTKQLSLKARIELHRQQHSCTNCHEKIDPWGIAFESFDATGRWRDASSVSFPIDSTTRLPDRTELAGAGDLAEYLLQKKETAIMLALVKNLMIYAAGSKLDVLDEAEARHVYGVFRQSGYNLKALAAAIARTRKFDENFNATLNATAVASAHEPTPAAP
jgi:hypothetical protein